MLVDKYAGRGDLYRTAEMYSIELCDRPMLLGTVGVHYDLTSGRYIALGIHTGDGGLYVATKLNASDFTPASLRPQGGR